MATQNFKRNCLFFLIFIYLFGCSGSQLQHVGSSSLTRDRTWAPCTGSSESQPLDHQGIPRMMILIFSQLIRHPLTKFFRLSNLLRVLNNPRMVATEFFGSFSCSCKRISFGDCSQLVVVSFWWPATVLLVFKALISFVKLREPRLHCTFVNIPRPSELLML